MPSPERAILEALETGWAEADDRRRRSGELDAMRDRCASLYGFVQEFWGVLEPGRPFVGGWAIQAICDHLEGVTRGEFNRLLITCPPGLGKSLLVGVFWPAWEWTIRPDLRFLATSYSEANVLRDNRKMRLLIESEAYQVTWGDRVQPTSKWGDQKIENAATGFREGRPFTSMTGGRGDRVLIDDPHSVDTAESDAQRAATVQTFREAIPDRLNDLQCSAIVIIMQRLHSQDVAGTILDLGLPYVHLNLPMEFEPDRRCSTPIFTDPRKEAGELLFPERFPREEVEKLKLVKGSYAYAGQYQQRPAPREGGLFKRTWFDFVAAAPAKARRTRAWDLASSTKASADWTAGVRLARDEVGLFYIEGVARGRLNPGEVERLILNTAHADTVGTAVRVPQDPGQAGKAQAGTLVRLLAGFDARAKPPSGDKLTRATPAAAQAEAGNIKIVRTGDPARDAWIEPFLDELCLFPAGAHDDQVDAFADALNDLALPTMKGAGAFEWMRQEAEALGIAASGEPALVRLRVPPGVSHVQGISGRSYAIQNDILEVIPEDAEPLKRRGYKPA